MSADHDHRAESSEDAGPSAAAGDAGSVGLVERLRQSLRSSVLVVDDPVRAELFEFWLDEGRRVRTATSPREAREAFDRSVAVALVRNEIGDDAKSTIEKQIRQNSPFCRTVVTTTEHVEIMFPGIEYDVCLSEPTTREEVRETVDRLQRRAQYQSVLRTYYDVTVAITNREVSDRANAASDGPGVDDLERARKRLREELSRLVSAFDEDDLTAVQEQLRPDPSFGPESSKADRKQGMQKRPASCVSCGRSWETGDRSGEKPYSRLGAFVWKCTACGAVQNLPDPSHRKIAK